MLKISRFGGGEASRFPSALEPCVLRRNDARARAHAQRGRVTRESTRLAAANRAGRPGHASLVSPLERPRGTPFVFVAALLSGEKLPRVLRVVRSTASRDSVSRGTASVRARVGLSGTTRGGSDDDDDDDVFARHASAFADTLTPSAWIPFPDPEVLPKTVRRPRDASRPRFRRHFPQRGEASVTRRGATPKRYAACLRQRPATLVATSVDRTSHLRAIMQFRSTESWTYTAVHTCNVAVVAPAYRVREIRA